MLGTLRLALAILVALSHAGVGILGLNPGVVAVVGFYVISGYVMTGLIRDHYSTPRLIGNFYVDRALRLFPHYLAVFGLVMIWFMATGARNEALARYPTFVDILQNLTIVPMNFFMFNDSASFAPIPPSWSLGAEIQFYLVVPLLLLLSLRRHAMAISVGIYVIAAWGVINTEWYGYRLLPGVLFMFLAGSLLYDSHHRGRSGARVVMLMVAGSIALAILLGLSGKLDLPFNRETLLGICLGVPLVGALATLGRRPWDEMLGNLSYGVFLNHFLVKWVFLDRQATGATTLAIYVAASIALSAVLFVVVERPALALRRKLRRG